MRCLLLIAMLLVTHKLSCADVFDTTAVLQQRCFNHIANRISNRRPAVELKQVVRVVNQSVLSDGSIRTDKGSGAIIKCTGIDECYILTAEHIFRDGETEITILFQDGRQARAYIHKRNSVWDAVLLRTDLPVGILPLNLSSFAVMPGDATFAWGFGQDGKLIETK